MADKSLLKVSVEMLEYYDTKIKQWHEENSNNKQYVVFASTSDFPETGEEETLYIDGSKIYVWSSTGESYELISSGLEEKDLEWGLF